VLHIFAPKFYDLLPNDHVKHNILILICTDNLSGPHYSCDLIFIFYIERSGSGAGFRPLPGAGCWVLVHATSVATQSPTQWVMAITTTAIRTCSPTIFHGRSPWAFAIK